MAVDSVGSIQANHEKYKQYFTSGDNNDISMDTFYELLVAEMTNQDPMEPMSNTEFISQMANFTSLQSQSDALYYSNANYAQSLVGKTVTVSTGAGEKTVTGTVESIKAKDKEFQVKVNGSYYDLSKVGSVEQTVTSSSQSTNGAFATSLIGKKVTVSGKNSSGATVVDQGTVNSIEIKNGVVSVIVNGTSFAISDVVKVEAADSTSAAADKTTAAEDTTATAESTAATAEKSDETTETGTLSAGSGNSAAPVETALYGDYTDTNEPDEEDLTDDALYELFGN